MSQKGSGRFYEVEGKRLSEKPPDQRSFTQKPSDEIWAPEALRLGAITHVGGEYGLGVARFSPKIYP